MTVAAIARTGALPITSTSTTQLIHMYGRGYDYNLGRFLSIDPIIQSPASSQSMNPYIYICNNPLSGTDPSGYAEAKEIDSVKVEQEKLARTGNRIEKATGNTTVTTTFNGRTNVKTQISGTSNGAVRSAAT